MMNSFAGYRVMTDERLPKEHIGDYIYWAHPLVQWLARFTRIRPYVIGGPIEREQAFVFGGDRLVMSSLMWRELVKHPSSVVSMDCTP